MARPILSSDEPNAPRFKMERFLHAGRQTMMTIYAPIAFGPLPVLAFQRPADRHLRLVASGALASSGFGIELCVIPLQPEHMLSRWRNPC